MSLKSLKFPTDAEIERAALGLRRAAVAIDNDGTPSQVGPTPEECLAIAVMLTRLQEQRLAARGAVRRARDSERKRWEKTLAVSA